jgi:hypothetical protein
MTRDATIIMAEQDGQVTACNIVWAGGFGMGSPKNGQIALGLVCRGPCLHATHRMCVRGVRLSWHQIMHRVRNSAWGQRQLLGPTVLLVSDVMRRRIAGNKAPLRHDFFGTVDKGHSLRLIPTDARLDAKTIIKDHDVVTRHDFTCDRRHAGPQGRV